MGVSARFTQVESPIKDAIKGPLSVTQDEKLKSIRMEPLTPLPPLTEPKPVVVEVDAAATGDGGEAVRETDAHG